MSSLLHAQLQRTRSAPVELGPGAAAPIIGLAAIFALAGTQIGIPLGTGLALGAVGGTASLLVHEFGHIRVARQLRGIRSATVSLMWLGAATRLEGRYLTGKEQIRVAIAGPRASFGFAGGLTSLVLLPLPAAHERALLLLALLNVAIGLLNLVPAAPLDGYKLLLGLAWSATGSERRAQRALGRVGRVVMFAVPPATAALLTVRPGLAVALATITVTLVAQKRLVARPTS
jgi:Zn-dependent protease